jgi:hypothetical protein
LCPMVASPSSFPLLSPPLLSFALLWWQPHLRDVGLRCLPLIQLAPRGRLRSPRWP